ncbi:hypothetical protein HPB51_018741 [Rhipicephalus microplus]|uniref:Uncharacterized protein n=1 Tax=Rhipicephalus microplus TaxID=6941 RepID=A0A9J6DI36_RHIMP|nr:hypothetical protein HPB51_018741 [Rhipicephalus microplus]
MRAGDRQSAVGVPPCCYRSPYRASRVVVVVVRRGRRPTECTPPLFREPTSNGDSSAVRPGPVAPTAFPPGSATQRETSPFSRGRPFVRVVSSPSPPLGTATRRLECRPAVFLEPLADSQSLPLFFMLLRSHCLSATTVSPPAVSCQLLAWLQPPHLRVFADEAVVAMLSFVSTTSRGREDVADVTAAIDPVFRDLAFGELGMSSGL